MICCGNTSGVRLRKRLDDQILNEESASAPALHALIDGKQLAAMCRIKALRHLHCCAVAVRGVEEWEHWPSQCGTHTRSFFIPS